MKGLKHLDSGVSAEELLVVVVPCGQHSEECCCT